MPGPDRPDHREGAGRPLERMRALHQEPTPASPPRPSRAMTRGLRLLRRARDRLRPLQRLRARDQGGAPPPGRGLPRVARAVVGLLAACAAIAGLAWVRSAAPPRALQVQRLTDGTQVRLVAVSSGRSQRYDYEPRVGLVRRAAEHFGRHLGDEPVTQQLDVPEGSLSLWLWIGKPRVGLADGLVAHDATGRTYRNGALSSPLEQGTAGWGRATLAWVSLTNFDRTASLLTFRVRCVGYRQTLEFTAPGPGQQVAAWAVSDQFPLVGGDSNADLRLWQLRAADSLQMADLLSLERIPPPHDRLVLAEVELREKAGRDKPGQGWTIEAVEAETSHGERLQQVHERRGLICLSNGRPPQEIDALRLVLKAEKRHAGATVLTFRHLTVPQKPGDVEAWARAAVAPPFAGAVLTCRQGARPDPGLLRVAIDGRAPAGSDIELGKVIGLDQEGRPVSGAGEDSPVLQERREGQDGVYWMWTFDLVLTPDAKTVALACEAYYRTVSVSTSATFLAKLQPPRQPTEMASVGLLLDPSDASDDVAPLLALVPNTRAATAPLQKGDLILLFDGLPPSMIPRALFRHGPEDEVEVVYQRGKKRFKTHVGLDPVVTAPQEPEPAVAPAAQEEPSPPAPP